MSIGKDWYLLPALSVKEIAGQLGYYSASHLSLEFKKARGKSPSQWCGVKANQTSMPFEPPVPGSAGRHGLAKRSFSAGPDGKH